jgi:tetratricopeptide (TPR) repeat protein
MAKENGEILSASGLLREVKALLANRRRRDAYLLVGQAVVRYGDDPFLLSYFGFLEAAVEGKYRSGIEACTRAITLFEKKILLGEDDYEEKLVAPLYLNLGKAYVAAGKRKEAIETLNTGLKYAKNHNDLLVTLDRLGIRKYVPLPCLKRSNPINDVIGRMLRRKKAEPVDW